MRQTKSCGCLIGGAVRDLEILKRKTTLKIEDINKKLKTVKESKKIIKLKAKKKDLVNNLKETIKYKKNMKKKFDEHVKKSGYVPPKLKIKKIWGD